MMHRDNTEMSGIPRRRITRPRMVAPIPPQKHIPSSVVKDLATRTQERDKALADLKAANEQNAALTNEIATLTEDIEKLAAERDGFKEKALRTIAEYDNYRKRMVAEQANTTAYANRKLLEELLPAIDNFEMGMQMASADTKSMIYIGMSMVQKQIQEFLTSQGVVEISANVGDDFDHNVHEAIMTEESEVEAGKVCRIVRKGYMLHDMLLRPVNVAVSATE